MDLQADHRQVDDRPLASGREIARQGIDRRTLIKRAAVAGAVAWTVPVVLDSLASPAAAASCGRLFRVEYRMDNPCSDVRTTTVGDTGQRPTDGTCLAGVLTQPPAAYTETVTNVASTGQTLAASGLAVSGACGAKSSGNVSFTFTGGTPTVVTGCSSPLTFLAAGIFSQNKNGSGVCQTRTFGASATTNITGLTGTQVDFTQPLSDKADASGDWQFVIGCACT